MAAVDKKVLQQVSFEAHQLLLEMARQAELCLVEQSTLSSVASSIASQLEFLPSADTRRCHEFIANIQWLRAEFVGIREQDALWMSLCDQINQMVLEQKVSEEEARVLVDRLSDMGDPKAARKWLCRYKARMERRASRVAAQTAQPCQNDRPRADQATAQPDHRVAFNEARAAAAKSPEGLRLYAAGLAATKRRDQIRFFKAAVHVERRLNA